MSLVKLAITRWRKELPIVEKFMRNINVNSLSGEYALKQKNIRDILGFRKFESIDSLPINNPIRRASYTFLKNNKDAKAIKLDPNSYNEFLNFRKSEGHSLGYVLEEIKYNNNSLAKEIAENPTIKGNPLHGFSIIPYRVLGTKNKYIDLFHGSNTLTTSNISSKNSIASPSSHRIHQPLNTLWTSTIESDARDYGNVIKSSVPMRDITATGQNAHSIVSSHTFIKGLKK